MTPRRQRYQTLREREALLQRAQNLAQGTKAKPRKVGRDATIVAAATADAWLFARNDALLAEHLSGEDLVEAAKRAGVDDFDLSTASPEELRGALITLRGARGEQWTLEAIELGLLPTPTGSHDVTLASFTEPGTDLTFSGDVPIDANVKVGIASSTLTQHLHKHPDVDVVYGSSDLADHAERLGVRVVETGAADFAVDGEPVVVDIGRSAGDFDAEITASLAQPDDGGLALPVVSAIAVTWRAIHRIRTRQSLDAVATQTARDVAITGSAHLAARLVRLTGAPDPVTAFAGFATATGIATLSTVRRGWLDVPSERELRDRVGGRRGVD